MNPVTHDVRSFPTTREAGVAGYTVPLTDEEAAHVQTLSPAERKVWLDANWERLEQRKRAAQAEEEIRRNFTPERSPLQQLSDEHLHRASNGQDKPTEKRTRRPGPGGQLPGRFKVRK